MTEEKNENKFNIDSLNDVTPLRHMEDTLGSTAVWSTSAVLLHSFPATLKMTSNYLSHKYSRMRWR